MSRIHPSSPTRRRQQQRRRRRRRPHLSGICFVLHSRLLLYLLASYSAYSSPILPHFFSCSPLPFMLSFSVSPHVPSPNGHSTGLPRLEKEGKVQPCAECSWKEATTAKAPECELTRSPLNHKRVKGCLLGHSLVPILLSFPICCTRPHFFLMSIT